MKSTITRKSSLQPPFPNLTTLKETIMTDTDTLHLWFKPYGGVINEADVSFIERYSRRFYPKAMGELTKQLHRLTAKITRMYPAGMFEYQLTHFTKKATNRYLIEESLRDAKDDTGLNISIQATTHEERKIFSECFEAETDITTQPVQNVVAYLEDSLESESHKWANAKMQNGEEALLALKEIIGFLKAIRNHVRVHTFEVNHGASGITMSIALLSPGVLSYYTRIDWNIM